MKEKTLELSIPWLLPGVEDEQDRCLERLVDELENQDGIGRAHIERDKSPADICLHFDSDRLSGDEVRQVAKQAGERIASRFHHRSLTVEGMDCSDCALVVEHGLSRMAGVLSVDVDFAAQSMRVEYDARRTNQKSIEKRVHQLGYSVPSKGLWPWLRTRRELVFSLSAGLALVVGWFGARLLLFPAAVATALYLAAYLLGGADITRHALHALREKRFDTDLLMVLAALGAAVLGDFAEGALLLFLFSLGHALEEGALERAQRAIRSLADLAPKTALVRRGGKEMVVPVERLAIGERVIVRPGVRVSADGEVVAGSSGVDQSPVTGESLPVEKGPGDRVFAGSVNGSGALEVQVDRLARDSTLARVVAMIEQAQAQKSHLQRSAEKFTTVFVPALLIADLGLIVIPPLLGVPFATAFLRAMTLLVAASPCALALAAPSAILAGIARAAGQGVLVKGGAHLESLGRLDAIAFDKTGTLTQGETSVAEVRSFGSLSETQVLTLAAAVEGQSAHPLAQAVASEAIERGLAVPPAEAVQAVTGRGIRARVDGQEVAIGSLRFFEEASTRVAGPIRSRVLELEMQGKSALLVSLGDELVGLVAVSDVIRPEAAAALAALHHLGLSRLIMLSGDNPQAAEHIAGQLGLGEYQAGLMPEDKLAFIQNLVREGQAVAMVGDGVNDAPALASATVGIAMGGAGTDVALETADVVLMASDLSKLPFAVGLGRATRQIIRQNLVLSLGVILVLAGLAVAGLAGIGMAVLIHEGSTLLVAANSLRLLRLGTPG